MENDYITNHIYIQNPQTFGIDLNQIEVSLGTRPNSDGEILSTEDNDNTYHTFQQFHRDALTEEQKIFMIFMNIRPLYLKNEQ